MLDGLQPFHLGIREIGKQGVAVVQSRCYEILYYAPCRICCDITADRRQPVEMEVASFAHCRHLWKFRGSQNQKSGKCHELPRKKNSFKNPGARGWEF